MRTDALAWMRCHQVVSNLLSFSTLNHYSGSAVIGQVTAPLLQASVIGQVTAPLLQASVIGQVTAHRGKI